MLEAPSSSPSSGCHGHRSPSKAASASATIARIASSTRASSHSVATSASCSLARQSSANAGEQERARLAQHLSGDHETLDLLGSLIDLRDLRVAHEALDRVLLDVAVAAEDLHRLGRAVHRDVAALELRHRRRLRQLRAVDAVVGHLAETVEQPARALALGFHVGELRLDQ